MINGVHHVAMATQDIDRIVAFYSQHLGFEVISEGQWADRPIIDDIIDVRESAARTAMLRAGNVYVEVFQYLNPEPGAGDPERPVYNPGYTHFCLDVTDIDAEYERLGAAGMTFHGPPPTREQLGGKIRALYGRDPDGNVIELQEIFDPEHPFNLDRLGGSTGAPQQ